MTPPLRGAGSKAAPQAGGARCWRVSYARAGSRRRSSRRRWQLSTISRRLHALLTSRRSEADRCHGASSSAGSAVSWPAGASATAPSARLCATPGSISAAERAKKPTSKLVSSSSDRLGRREQQPAHRRLPDNIQGRAETMAASLARPSATTKQKRAAGKHSRPGAPTRRVRRGAWPRSHIKTLEQCWLVEGHQDHHPGLAERAFPGNATRASL